MKEQTALQELIEWVDTFQPYGLSRADVRHKATKLLTKEREQIEKAHDNGISRFCQWEPERHGNERPSATDYFTTTYKQPL